MARPMQFIGTGSPKEDKLHPFLLELRSELRIRLRALLSCLRVPGVRVRGLWCQRPSKAAQVLE